MAKIRNGGSATGIPQGEDHAHAWGMSVRQFYKAAAITGLLSSHVDPDWLEKVPEIAARIADALLDEDEDFGEILDA
jgi:hypothetical protein